MTDTTTLPQPSYLQTDIAQHYIRLYPGVQNHIRGIETILESNPLSKSPKQDYFIYRAWNLSEYLSNAICEIYKQDNWHVTEEKNKEIHTFKFHKIRD